MLEWYIKLKIKHINFRNGIILEQEEADKVFDEGPPVQSGDHQHRLVVSHVSHLHTQMALNAASPDLL